MRKLLALSHKGHTRCSAAPLTFPDYTRERDEDRNMQSRHHSMLQKLMRLRPDSRNRVTRLVTP